MTRAVGPTGRRLDPPPIRACNRRRTPPVTTDQIVSLFLLPAGGLLLFIAFVWLLARRR